MILKFSLFWSYLNAFEYIKFSDLNQTLKDYSEDSWKTLERILGKSCNIKCLIRLPEKSSESFWEVFQSLKTEKTFKNKILCLNNNQDSYIRLNLSKMGTTLDKRLLGNSSSIKCIRRLPKKSFEKSSESLMRSLQNSDSDLKNFAYSKHPNEFKTEKKNKNIFMLKY